LAADSVIVIYSWYPASKAQEVQTRFGEISEEKGQSSAIKSVRSYTSVGENGAQVAAYHEVEEGNIEEAIRFLSEFMSGFWSIDGYRYRFDFALSPAGIADFSTRISKYALK
jgi:hypothetical protein